MSGSISAMEEDYDILGVYALGLVTAFGGGIIRNLLIEASPLALWEQGDLIAIAMVASSVVYFAPQLWLNHVRKWIFFDAIGLAAFSISGALLAAQKDLPLAAVVLAALLTGCGGGMLRDILARRKPLIFREEVYGVWAMVGGLLVGIGFGRDGWQLYALVIVILSLRMLSVYRNWRLPRRTFQGGLTGSNQ
ncbi:trimeric intracellular cation channel family protein [Paenibacillus sp. TRM 82003]|nr:trimeric intracellular cation channel family protein [Paenibacillus sp. TRM 82003]